MTQTGPSKSERVAGVALPLLFVVGTIIFAVSYRSVFSIVFAVFAAIMIPVSILRSRKVAEKEMIRRLDRAMATKDDKSDPREMARWVP
jgi:hypothetical protein